MGFWSAIQLALNIFRPSETPALVSSFRHMDKHSKLKYEHKHDHEHAHHLQIGFTIEEMTIRMEGLLKSIGLTNTASQLHFVHKNDSSLSVLLPALLPIILYVIIMKCDWLKVTVKVAYTFSQLDSDSYSSLCLFCSHWLISRQTDLVANQVISPTPNYIVTVVRL